MATLADAGFVEMRLAKTCRRLEHSARPIVTAKIGDGAVETLDAESGECTLVGDSVTDIQGP